MSDHATNRQASVVAVRVLTTVVFLGGSALGALPPAAGAGTPVPSLGDMVALCGHFRPILLPDGRALCSHGADPAPDGVDSRVPHSLAPGRSQGLIFHDPPGDAPSKASATPGIGCYGDGRDGNRVQAIYAVPVDHPDRFSQVVPFIRQWAAETDAVFQRARARQGGTRRIRIVDARTAISS